MCKRLRIIMMAVCALFLWPLSAQEKGDTVYTFRFVPEDDMFYVPWNGNGNELSRLAACVERYREEILDGRMPLRVDGYCRSFDSEAENLATAKTRSNRVKSELIVRQKLTEDCFITKNHSGSGDYVTVRLVIPAEWTVTMGDYTGTEAGETHAPDYLFEPGIYTLAAYNTPEDITISGTTATVVQETGNSTGTYISNAPGWLFTSVQEVTVEADTDYELTAAMHQQVRQLTLVIEPTGDASNRIESIEGSLSGAAGTLDFATGTYGAASDVALHFTRITEGSDAGKWTATVRLLGITGNTQTLTATLTYADGNPADTGLESDLSTALADFNADKTVPLTLGGEAVVQAGVTATIDDWQPGNNGGEDVEIY